MPQCRRDQMKFAHFLLAVIAIESLLVFIVMTMEHNTGERIRDEKIRKWRIEHEIKKNNLSAQKDVGLKLNLSGSGNIVKPRVVKSKFMQLLNEESRNGGGVSTQHRERLKRSVKVALKRGDKNLSPLTVDKPDNRVLYNSNSEPKRELSLHNRHKPFSNPDDGEISFHLDSREGGKSSFDKDGELGRHVTKSNSSIFRHFFDGWSDVSASSKGRNKRRGLHGSML